MSDSELNRWMGGLDLASLPEVELVEEEPGGSLTPPEEPGRPARGTVVTPTAAWNGTGPSTPAAQEFASPVESLLGPDDDSPVAVEMADVGDESASSDAYGADVVEDAAPASVAPTDVAHGAESWGEQTPPVADVEAAVSEPPLTDDQPVADALPVADTPPAVEESPAAEDALPSEEPAAVQEPPVAVEQPRVDEQPVGFETPAASPDESEPSGDAPDQAATPDIEEQSPPVPPLADDVAAAEVADQSSVGGSRFSLSGLFKVKPLSQWGASDELGEQPGAMAPEAGQPDQSPAEAQAEAWDADAVEQVAVPPAGDPTEGAHQVDPPEIDAAPPAYVPVSEGVGDEVIEDQTGPPADPAIEEVGESHGFQQDLQVESGSPAPTEPPPVDDGEQLPSWDEQFAAAESAVDESQPTHEDAEPGDAPSAAPAAATHEPLNEDWRPDEGHDFGTDADESPADTPDTVATEPAPVASLDPDPVADWGLSVGDQQPDREPEPEPAIAAAGAVAAEPTVEADQPAATQAAPEPFMPPDQPTEEFAVAEASAAAAVPSAQPEHHEPVAEPAEVAPVAEAGPVADAPAWARHEIEHTPSLSDDSGIELTAVPADSTEWDQSDEWSTEPRQPEVEPVTPDPRDNWGGPAPEADAERPADDERVVPDADWDIAAHRTDVGDPVDGGGEVDLAAFFEPSEQEATPMAAAPDGFDAANGVDVQTEVDSTENVVPLHSAPDPAASAETPLTMDGLVDLLAPLGDYLTGAAGEPEISLSLDEIERVIGSRLPDPAYAVDEWWSNRSDGGFAHVETWLYAGWRAFPDLTARQVTFRRPI